MSAEDKAGLLMAILIIVAVMALFGSLVWMTSDGYDARVKAKRNRDRLELKRAERELEMDLRLREWQATASLEDVTRHRERLERSLDRAHGEEGQADG